VLLFLLFCESRIIVDGATSFLLPFVGYRWSAQFSVFEAVGLLRRVKKRVQTSEFAQTRTRATPTFHTKKKIKWLKSIV